MVIRFERTGGFTGMSLRVVIDTTALQPVEHQNLSDLVRAAGFFQLPALLPGLQGGADRFTYKLTVEESKNMHTVEVGESGLPESLRPLIQQLEKLARTLPKA